MCVMYLATAYRIVFVERWGPVVSAVDAAGGHGVHSGDLVGIAAALVGALLGWFSLVLTADAISRVTLTRRTTPTPTPFARQRVQAW